MLTGLAVSLGPSRGCSPGWRPAWVLTVLIVVGVLRPRVPTARVLAMYGARPLPRWAAPRLHEVVDVLAAGARPHRGTVVPAASPRGRGERSGARRSARRSRAVTVSYPRVTHRPRLRRTGIWW